MVLAHIRLRCAVALVTLLGLPGCSMVELQQDLSKARGVGLITGEVDSPRQGGSILVALYRHTEQGSELVNVDQLTAGQAHFVFILESTDSYRLMAIHDLNDDQVWQSGEPLGNLNGGRAFELAAGLRLENQDLHLDRSRPPAGLSTDFSGLDLRALESVHIASGEIAELDDERFSPDRAKAGMWSPLSSTLDFGAGVYFLEPYDPKRTPVLFVHGIGGSPRDFSYLIEHLDRSRFQPWVYHYPSGVRLGRIAESLARLIRGLHRKHGFESAVLAAHSMGGLVSRAALLARQEDASEFPIDLFVTFSTPWDGHQAAANGVKYAPAVVPSWIDMKPGSDFLAGCKEPLPDGLDHHLFFGFRTGNNPLMLYSHDSVVSVASQLAPWAQEQSARTYGYNLDHVEILSDGQVQQQFAEILDRYSARRFSRGRF